MWSVETFANLQENATAKPSWRQVGSLRVALTDARVDEFQQLRQVADRAQLDVDLIDRRAAEARWPRMDFRQAKAVLWCPTDGYLQPSDLTMAYVAASRKLGVRFATGTQVTEVLVDRGRVAGIATDQGTLSCQTVINAAGAHAYHIARSAGLELPIVPVRHEYFVTVRSEGLEPTLPVIRIPDLTLYLRGEVGALLVGGWEPSAQSADPRQFALRDDPPPISEDWDVLAEFANLLSPYLPRVSELGIRSVFRGWPTFTPDGRFIVGESCRLKGFVMAGGCNAHGVSGSAGLGRYVVESILEDDPSPYVKSLSPDRFTETQWDWAAARRAAQHVYETYYALESTFITKGTHNA
jgi:glycine/D-amino acid oxidase-like deaminating enzyme